MITLLDTVGPAVLRSSWQAAVLAIVVFLLMRFLGEHIALGGAISGRLILLGRRETRLRASGFTREFGSTCLRSFRDSIENSATEHSHNRAT